MKLFKSLLLISITVSVALSQTDQLTNDDVLKLTAAGLTPDLIAAKIGKSSVRFNISADALIELKKAGVDDTVIKLMLERAEAVLPGVAPRDPDLIEDKARPDKGDPKEAVRLARTIGFKKSSAHPSRQNLEKALLKNKDFQRTALTILRDREDADLLVEIGFVSGSWLTHRYVYRIFDRRSAAVIAAGETTSWGSLADNLAKHIARSLGSLAGP